jgi:hypothetical protein
VPHSDEVIIDVPPVVISSQGLVHHNGVVYAAFDNADLVRRQLGTTARPATVDARAWLRRGATVPRILGQQSFGSAPTLFDRCAWCEERFFPGEPATRFADRFLHDRRCREEFDRSLAEAELERAQATLRLTEA